MRHAPESRLSIEGDQRKLEQMANARVGSVSRPGPKPTYFPKLGNRVFEAEYPGGFPSERMARLEGHNIKARLRDELGQPNGSI